MKKNRHPIRSEVTFQPHSIYPFAGLYSTYRILSSEILGQMVHFMNLRSGLIRHLKPRRSSAVLMNVCVKSRSATIADSCGPCYLEFTSRPGQFDCCI